MASMKLPKIDLKKLRAEKARNKQERRKFIQWYANRIREGKA